MRKVLSRAIAKRIRIPKKDEIVRFDSGYVKISRKIFFEIENFAISVGKKYNKARNIFVQKILRNLAKQLIQTGHLNENDGIISATANDLIEYAESLIKSNEYIVRIINLCWLPLTPNKLLSDLYAKKDFLRISSAGILDKNEQDLLYRENNEKWSNSDIALLDELNALLGKSQADKQGETEEQQKEDINFIKQVMKNYGVGGFYSDKDLIERYFGDGTRNIKNIDPDKKKYGHIIIDEAQEISPMEWRMIKRRAINHSMTIVGDLAQSRFDYGANTWNDYLNIVLKSSFEIKNLHINYRTDKKIMDYAQKFAKNHDIKATKVESIKEKTSDSVFEFESLEKEKLYNELKKLDGKTGIIINDKDAHNTVYEYLLKRGLDIKTTADGESVLLSDYAIITARESKGLEFDNVVVIVPHTIKPNDLYVALTRATEKLFIINKIV
jgi:DNA helicase IV